jgi:hypothetical protein
MPASSRPEQPQLPDWESELIEEAIRAAERRRDSEKASAKRRALQLAREQGYHRLAAAIDRPRRHKNPKQLKLFSSDPTLFDDDAG